MFHIKIEGAFEAAHFLRSYFPDGSAEPLHGHSWRVFVSCTRSGQKLSKKGIVVDFFDLRPEFDKLLKDLHHSCLNKHEDFQEVNPTAENVALWFYQRLLPVAQEKKIIILEVGVQEKPGNLAIFTPPPSVT